MQRGFMKKVLTVMFSLVLVLGLVSVMKTEQVSAAEKSDVKVTFVSFGVKDGDFVAGESEAIITFKINKASAVKIAVYDSDDDVVYTKSLKKGEAKPKKKNTVTWNGKKAESDEYYVVVTAGSSKMISEKLFFYAETGFAKGNGSKKNPYIVSTPEEFVNVARFNGRYFKQTKNLDFSSTDFIPIFSNNTPFVGVYDGNDKTIKNISYNGNADYTGFFRYIGKEGLVQNLNFSDCLITGAKYVGMIAGCSLGEVKNCTVKECTITASGDYTGIAVGWNGGKITSCKLSDNLTKGNGYGGGASGYNSSTGVVKSVTTENNTITGNNNYHGGIIGYNDGTISMCVAKDNTIGGNHYNGGIVGGNYSIISKCEVSNLKSLIGGRYSRGNITGRYGTGATETECVYYGDPVK